MLGIGIARALFHRPGVLALDAATSALENDTECGLMEAVKSLHGKLAILFVAHCPPFSIATSCTVWEMAAVSTSERRPNKAFKKTSSRAIN